MKKKFSILVLLASLLAVSFSFSAFATDAANDMTDAWFQIDVKTFTPGGGDLFMKGEGTYGMINVLLWNTIQYLMIAMGTLALLTMTIGAGYMIIHAGNDEMLSKGKSIFTSGLIALAVALSSYYIVALVRYLLYS